ncbi:MFS transporter [Halomonas salifodinae]|uniref:MFS transporter n=1 Tax=Halomonas salifodinae TaxID=438745 RepID=A0ABW2F3D7_9GAMM
MTPDPHSPAGSEPASRVSPTRRLDPDGYPATFLVSLAGFGGLVVLAVLPLMITSLVVELGHTEAQAGLVVSANLFGTALGMLGVAALLRRTGLKALAAVGAGLILACELASLGITALEPLTLVRLASGLGGGLLAGAAYAWAARRRSPERGFAMLLLLQFLGAGLLLFLLEAPVARFGLSALYLTFAGCALLALLCIPAMGRTAPDASAPLGSARRGTASIWRDWRLWGLLLAIALFEIANAGAWAFLQSFGQALALPEAQIHGVTVIAGGIGGVGALAVMWLGERRGRTLPLAGGLLLSLAATAALLLERGLLPYATAVMVLSICWAFTLPYLQGALAQLDRYGELTAIGSFVIMFSVALGPWLVGMTIANGGIALGLLLILGCFAACLATALPVTRRTDASPTPTKEITP